MSRIRYPRNAKRNNTSRKNHKAITNFDKQLKSVTAELTEIKKEIKNMKMDLSQIKSINQYPEPDEVIEYFEEISNSLDDVFNSNNKFKYEQEFNININYYENRII